MGIPSFYRHLCRRHPRLIGVGVGRTPEWLCLDFNCAMYHVLRKMRPVGSTEAGGREAWEAEFADAIAGYMRQLVELARPTKGVYVSCDGVVCAAKRRQQRMRRFRGPWFAAAEGEARRAQDGPKEDDGPTWDQNALTPGTVFMERLGGVLEAMGRRIAAASGGALDVRVSTTAEPGEGEHKLLAAMRGLPVAPRTVTIYGLDADLILLSALLGADTGAEVLLMREAQEFERGGPPNLFGGSDEWRHLNVRGLVEAVIGSKGDGVADRVRDWVAAMSLLGNDFLPRSLTRTVRDGGIPALLGALRDEVWSEGRQLVGADGRLSRTALLALLRVWAATEEADMTGAVREAVRQAGVARRSTGALEEWQSSPARWCSLGRLSSETNPGVLKPAWRRVYREIWRAGPADDYLAGLAWVWDYYSGRKVCLGWCYDHHLPPLWGDLVVALEGGGGATIEPPAVRWAEPLPAWTHLLSVLPAESVVTLLPVERGARYVAAEPWWWPASWSLFDIGRGQMWECEAVLPLVPESTLRRWSATTTVGGAVLA